jgi:hypothetical protein
MITDTLSRGTYTERTQLMKIELFCNFRTCVRVWWTNKMVHLAYFLWRRSGKSFLMRYEDFLNFMYVNIVSLRLAWIQTRPACASTQSDQDPRCSLTNPFTSRETDSEQHVSWSDCADAQAGRKSTMLFLSWHGSIMTF